MSGLDFLIEVGTEEIPAGYIAPALAALEERLAKSLQDNLLEFDGSIRTWATPRRLAAAVFGLHEGQPDREVEVTGPSLSAARDAEGAWTKAALGFARGQGVEVSDLAVVETEKGAKVMARKSIPGRPAADVLAALLPPLILGLPFPKSMRWGRGEIVFVRPIHWLVALLGGRVLPMSLGDVQASDLTRGHRFMHPEAIRLGSADEYEARLAEAGVIASGARREALVREEIARVVEAEGRSLAVLPDEGLVVEVSNLVESPVAVLGRFEESFLELPEPVLITAMREHQRYFAVTGEGGGLEPCFVAINNTRARDLAVVRRGHERVLRARLEDARFYYRDDLKTPVEVWQEKLERVVFHTLLGTSWRKVERIARMAEILAGLLNPDLKSTVSRAARLCKCDLVTGVVGEFPSLQGIMGRIYAKAWGASEAEAEAVYEHYLPIRADGDLPKTEAGALLGLADKIDSIVGFFGVGLVPTGAADPYALRRQALGVIRIIVERPYRLSLGAVIDQALAGLGARLKKPADEIKAEVVEFFRLRLKNQLTSRGASTDGAEAVLSLHHDDLVAATARVWALEEVKGRPDFSDLAVAFKRVVNIIRKFGPGDVFEPERLVEDQEKELLRATKDLEAQTGDRLQGDDYLELLQRIITIKPAVDAFFDHVLVDDPDPAVKSNRLALLARVAGLFELVADFSKIST
ncbi:MAG: glycine--tRNA ligase subunit beta [Proteobacteria bacterium]|nr:glycine--tRNA ligase subunit beta [Pseudomonadota bacterium]